MHNYQYGIERTLWIMWGKLWWIKQTKCWWVNICYA